MAESYRTYQFQAKERPNSFDFATPHDMMEALEDICREGVRLKKDVNDLPLVGGVEVFYLIGNAVVRNKTSGVSPYCQTEVICYGKPVGNIIEKYREFYHSDPTVIHF